MTTATCAHCGTTCTPTHEQRKSQGRGLRIFCTPAHSLALHKADQYSPDGLYADWEGSQLACCGTFHAITAIPFVAPCCGRTWLEEAACL